MSIRIGHYNYKTKYVPFIKNYSNVIIHTTGELSPFEMKDDDGIIMENFWQFSKIWPSVGAIIQPISKWKPDEVRWKYHDEVHYADGKIMPAYWNWRKRGFENPDWVRYPNGYDNRATYAAHIFGGADNYKILEYTEARKKIYYNKYRELATKTKQFKVLEAQLTLGMNVQICEVDAPKYDTFHPFNLVENGSILVNKELLTALINDKTQVFGHGCALAAALLNIDF